jgi:O-antigen ligase
MLFNGLILSHNKKYVNIVAKTFLFVSFVISLFPFLIKQFAFAGKYIHYLTPGEFKSVFLEANHFGAFLALSAVLTAILMFYSNKHIDLILLSCLLGFYLGELLINGTISALVASFISIACIAVKGIKLRLIRKVMFCFFIVFSMNLALIIALYKSGALNENYFEMFKDSIYYGDWVGCIDLIKEKPIAGVGLQNILRSYHNGYLQLMLFTGVPGLLIYLFSYLTGIKMVLKAQDDNFNKLTGLIIITYLVYLISGSTTFYVTPYHFVVLGIFYSGLVKAGEKSEGNKFAVT